MRAWHTGLAHKRIGSCTCKFCDAMIASLYHLSPCTFKFFHLVCRKLRPCISSLLCCHSRRRAFLWPTSLWRCMWQNCWESGASLISMQNVSSLSKHDSCFDVTFYEDHIRTRLSVSQNAEVTWLFSEVAVSLRSTQDSWEAIPSKDSVMIYTSLLARSSRRAARPMQAHENTRQTLAYISYCYDFPCADYEWQWEASICWRLRTHISDCASVVLSLLSLVGGKQRSLLWKLTRFELICNMWRGDWPAWRTLQSTCRSWVFSRIGCRSFEIMWYLADLDIGAECIICYATSGAMRWFC